RGEGAKRGERRPPRRGGRQDQKRVVNTPMTPLLVGRMAAPVCGADVDGGRSPRNIQTAPAAAAAPTRGNTTPGAMLSCRSRHLPPGGVSLEHVPLVANSQTPTPTETTAAPVATHFHTPNRLVLVRSSSSIKSGTGSAPTVSL